MAYLYMTGHEWVSEWVHSIAQYTVCMLMMCPTELINGLQLDFMILPSVLVGEVTGILRSSNFSN